MPDWLDRDPEETARVKRVQDIKQTTMTLEEKLALYFVPRAIANGAEPVDD